MDEVKYITVNHLDDYMSVNILRIGMKLILKKEHDNPYDDEAIAVYSEHGNKVGYVANSILTPNTEESEKDIQFIADVHNISNDIKPIMPVVKKQGNHIVIRPDKLREVTKRIGDAFAEKRNQKKVFPRLFIDYQNIHHSFSDLING